MQIPKVRKIESYSLLKKPHPLSPQIWKLKLKIY